MGFGSQLLSLGAVLLRQLGEPVGDWALTDQVSPDLPAPPPLPPPAV
jgi:hypothetical protein